jgi:hypothetical protein
VPGIGDPHGRPVRRGWSCIVGPWLSDEGDVEGACAVSGDKDVARGVADLQL